MICKPGELGEEKCFANLDSWGRINALSTWMAGDGKRIGGWKRIQYVRLLRMRQSSLR